MRDTRPRWDIDTRGNGSGDGRRLAGGVSELLEALSLPGWVAEDPDAHLLPHLRSVCEADSTGLELLGAEVDAEAAYVVRLRWQDDPDDLGGLRAAAFALIGAVAESATYVRQRRPAGNGSAPADVDDPGAAAVVFEVATGMLEGDTTFATHGHVLLLHVERGG